MAANSAFASIFSQGEETELFFPEARCGGAALQGGGEPASIVHVDAVELPARSGANLSLMRVMASLRTCSTKCHRRRGIFLWQAMNVAARDAAHNLVRA